MSRRIPGQDILLARSFAEVQADGEARTRSLEARVKMGLVKTLAALGNGVLWVMGSVLFTRATKAGRVKHIVAYTHGILGDNVVHLPTLAALKRGFPNASLHLVTDMVGAPEAAGDLFLRTDFIDAVTVIRGQPFLRKGRRLVLDPALAALRADLFVNLSPYGNRGWFKAVVREVLFARRLGARRAAGFRLSTKRIHGRFNDVQHAFILNEPRRGDRVLRELGIEPVAARDTIPRDAAVAARVRDLLRSDGVNPDNFIVLNPGGNLEIKHWGVERFGELAARLVSECGADVVITGMATERGIAQRVVAAGRGRVFDYAGRTTVGELIELLGMSRLCVSNDTGTMHVAALIEVPTVGIFGTRFHPSWWFPRGQRVTAIYRFVPCSFCFLDQCGHRSCLEGVDVETVFAAARSALYETGTGDGS